MRKYLKKISLCIVCLFVISGCNADNFDTYDTVENLFDAAQSNSSSSVDDSTSLSDSNIISGNESSLDEEIYNSDNIFFGVRFSTGLQAVDYGGGEVNLVFELESEGLSKKGVGILLFLDGKPQPFYMPEYEDNLEYAYMQCIYPEDTGDCENHSLTFSFIPVTGCNGDTLEVWAVLLIFPNYSYSSGTIRYAYDPASSTCCATQIQFNADPPEFDAEVEASPFAADDYTMTTSDCTDEEISGWSDEDLLTQLSSLLFVNDEAVVSLSGRGNKVRYEISNEDTVTVRFEVWGTPYGEYGLTFFCDNKPVLIDGEISIDIKLEIAQKTSVEIEIPMSAFDGTCKICAMLTPKNYCVNRLSNLGYVEGLYMKPSYTCYLTSEEQ